MDQTHSRAREALQPFIHLANSTDTSSPRLIANLITNATSNPQTFFFAELLETPTIQSLRSPGTPDEYQGYLTLLEIFSWGTWREYQCKLPHMLRNEAARLHHQQLPRTSRPSTQSKLRNSAFSHSSPSQQPQNLSPTKPS